MGQWTEALNGTVKRIYNCIATGHQVLLLTNYCHRPPSTTPYKLLPPATKYYSLQAIATGHQVLLLTSYCHWPASTTPYNLLPPVTKYYSVQAIATGHQVLLFTNYCHRSPSTTPYKLLPPPHERMWNSPYTMQWAKDVLFIWFSFHTTNRRPTRRGCTPQRRNWDLFLHILILSRSLVLLIDWTH